MQPFVRMESRYWFGRNDHIYKILRDILIASCWKMNKIVLRFSAKKQGQFSSLIETSIRNHQFFTDRQGHAQRIITWPRLHGGYYQQSLMTISKRDALADISAAKCQVHYGFDDQCRWHKAHVNNCIFIFMKTNDRCSSFTLPIFFFFEAKKKESDECKYSCRTHSLKLLPISEWNSDPQPVWINDTPCTVTESHLAQLIFDL